MLVTAARDYQSHERTAGSRPLASRVRAPNVGIDL